MTIREIIVNKIINGLENNIIPWHKPWSTNSHTPQSITGHKYHGINFFLTKLSDYVDHRWLTARQANINYQALIKSGEKATPIVYWNFFEREVNGEIKRIPFLKYYNCFNVEQLQGGNIPKLEIRTYDFSPIERADHAISNMNIPTIIQSNRAAYRIEEDVICIPPKSLFENPEHYYATLFHEIAHSTKHFSRMNRDTNDDQYGVEELIAEMSAAILCSEIGISNTVIQNQTAYVQNWIRAIRGNSNILFKATQTAQKVVDFLLNRQGEEYVEFDS